MSEDASGHFIRFCMPAFWYGHGLSFLVHAFHETHAAVCCCRRERQSGNVESREVVIYRVLGVIVARWSLWLRHSTEILSQRFADNFIVVFGCTERDRFPRLTRNDRIIFPKLLFFGPDDHLFRSAFQPHQRSGAAKHGRIESRQCRTHRDRPGRGISSTNALLRRGLSWSVVVPRRRERLAFAMTRARANYQINAKHLLLTNNSKSRGVE